MYSRECQQNNKQQRGAAKDGKVTRVTAINKLQQTKGNTKFTKSLFFSHQQATPIAPTNSTNFSILCHSQYMHLRIQLYVPAHIINTMHCRQNALEVTNAVANQINQSTYQQKNMLTPYSHIWANSKRRGMKEIIIPLATSNYESNMNCAPVHIRKRIDCVRHKNDRGKPLFLFSDHSTFFLRRCSTIFTQRKSMPNLFPNQ